MIAVVLHSVHMTFAVAAAVVREASRADGRHLMVDAAKHLWMNDLKAY
jgi:hypothetical protein